MNTTPRQAYRLIPCEHFRLLLALISCGGMLAREAGAQTRESQTGESAAEALKRSIAAEQYNLQIGPVRASVGASLAVNYTDNVFYSEQRDNDVMIQPGVNFDALWPISELNTLRFSLGVSYEWYQENTSLNANTPLINPGSELVFNVFVGDVHIRLHDAFSYQESLFFNSPNGNQPFFNFNNTGTFARLDNKVGFDATWDLDKYVLAAGFDHENFKSYSASFDYMDRMSEWGNASAGYRLGDHFIVGTEGRLAYHDYDQQTTLNNNWRGQVGPYLDVTLMEGVHLRGGGGYSMAEYNAAGESTSDYDNYYAYGTLSQQTRLFTHSITGGHETLLGDNANNMRTTYARYSISSPIIRNVELEGNVSVNFAEESGGPSGFDERFTYYAAGFKAGWQFHKYWRTELGYEYLLKDSELAGRNYQRNRVTLALLWKF
jgi:hypothetical protein